MFSNKTGCFRRDEFTITHCGQCKGYELLFIFVYTICMSNMGTVVLYSTCFVCMSETVHVNDLHVCRQPSSPSVASATRPIWSRISHLAFRPTPTSCHPPRFTGFVCFFRLVSSSQQLFSVFRVTQRFS